jgi:hypothetical protein
MISHNFCIYNTMCQMVVSDVSSCMPYIHGIINSTRKYN